MKICKKVRYIPCRKYLLYFMHELTFFSVNPLFCFYCSNLPSWGNFYQSVEINIVQDIFGSWYIYIYFQTITLQYHTVPYIQPQQKLKLDLKANACTILDKSGNYGSEPYFILNQHTQFGNFIQICGIFKVPTFILALFKPRNCILKSFKPYFQ